MEGELTDKQKRFCEEYLVDFNATQAAARAGYSADTAYSIGWENLRKPEIKSAIEARMAEMSLSSAEVLKSLSDIAKGDLKEYFVIRKETRTEKVSISLGEFIARRKEEIRDKEHIHSVARSQGLLGDGEALDNAEKHHASAIRDMRYSLIALELQLAKDPDATVIVDGEPKLVEVAELDIAKLVKDKAAGKIKTFHATDTGTKVELYPADAALDKLAKHHGLYDKDNHLNIEHSGQVGALSAEQIRSISKALEDEV